MKNNIIIFTILTTLSLVACSKQPDTATKGKDSTTGSSEVILTEAQYKAADIILGSVEERGMTNLLRANGIVDAPPQDLVSISVPFGGFLKNLLVREGTHVRKGQTLAVIVNAEYIDIQQEYLRNYYQLQYLKMEYERQKSLATENVTAQKVFQETTSRFFATEATVKGLQAKLRLLKINLDDLEKGTIQQTITLSSPIDGFIIDMKANTGAYASPTDILFKIIDLTNAFVSITVFEKDLGSITLGQNVHFINPSNNDTCYGQISAIGREIEADRSSHVQATLANKGTFQLFKGMIVTASIETGIERTVSAIPSNAIALSENKQHIFVLDSMASNHYKFTIVEVETGISAHGYTQIVLPDGVNNRSKIVIHGASNLLAALKNTGEEE